MTDVNDPLQEILDRTRRIETRMTRFLEERGFDTKVQRPAWSDGVVTIPTLGASLKDILSVIPRRWTKEVEVECDGESVITLYFK
jgi:exonuclease VII large subunit